MSTRQLDNLAKRMATGTSRRSVLHGMGGLALGAAGVVATARIAGADDDRCNRPGERRCFRRCRRRGWSIARCRDGCCDD